MAGSFAGGFSQGFASSYQPGRRQQEQRLREVLKLQQEEFEYRKQQDNRTQTLNEQQFGLQQEQFGFQKDQAGQQASQFGQQFELDTRKQNFAEEAAAFEQRMQDRAHQVQMRALDVNTYDQVSKILDSKLPTPQRQFLTKGLLKSLGIDPKSEEAKDFSTMILKSEADTLAVMQETLAAAYPTMQPGQLTAMAKTMFSGMMAPNDMANLFKPAPVQLKPIVSPDDPSKNIYVPEELAVGQEVPQADPMVAIDQRAETAAAGKLADYDFEGATKRREVAEASQTMMPAIQTLKRELSSGAFQTGVAGGARMQIGRVAEFLGMDPTAIPGIGSPATAENINALTRFLATSVTDKLSRTTNMSLGFVNQSVPELVKTPEGNRLIIENIENAANRDIAIFKEQERYLSKYGSLRPDPEENPGVLSFEEARERIITDFAERDADMEKRMRKEVAKAKSINLGSLFSETTATQPRTYKKGDRGRNAEGKIVVFDGKTWVPQ